ncbi:MAG: NUDIX domain-containing protein [Bacilli bacterium]|nr:NUDIX domain-containing protein [Bacilli bacterium]MBN2877422.1 NUDIX domain-containing protein [Bacilli bacterium]
MEQFDIYDLEGNKLNKLMERGTRNQEGEYHLVTHIWFRNPEGRYLVQQRNKMDDRIPHQWAATGGAILAGETSIQGTMREVKEELGLSLKEEDYRLVKRLHTETSFANYLTDLYLVEQDIDLGSLVLDPSEVKDVAYKTMNEIKEMIQNNQFWNYEYLELLEKSSL